MLSSKGAVLSLRCVLLCRILSKFSDIQNLFLVYSATTDVENVTAKHVISSLPLGRPMFR